MASDLQREQVAAAAAVRLRHLEQQSAYDADPWRFLVDRVQLLDPLTPDDPIRPYPDLPYLEFMIREWETYRKVIVWKPRRMKVSWTALAYADAKAAHRRFQRVFLIAKKLGEDDTEGTRELLWRAGFVVEHLRDGPPVELDKRTLLLTFPGTGSTISAVSSEPDALRQVSATLVIGDEFAFWDYPEKSLAAFLPTLERKGQFLGISSSATGFFYRTIFDLDDGEEPNLDEHGVPRAATDVTTYPDLERSWMQAWTNPKNGFRIIDLNLEADPEKRTEEGLARVREGTSPAIWDQEYRKKFLVRGGRPIFQQEYVPARMVRDLLPPVPTEPMLIGLDFGYVRPAACVGQLIDGVQFRIYRTLVGDHVTLKTFIPQLLAKMQQWYPSWRAPINWCCDVSGNRTRGEDEDAITTLRKEFGIRARSKYALIPTSLDQIRDYMNTNYKGDPCFLIARHPDTLFLRRGLEDGYRYPRPTDTNPDPQEPERGNAWRDVMDAMRYIPLNFGARKTVTRDPSQVLRIARRDILPARVYVR